jgi:hypothetical protein
MNDVHNFQGSRKPASRQKKFYGVCAHEYREHQICNIPGRYASKADKLVGFLPQLTYTQKHLIPSKIYAGDYGAGKVPGRRKFLTSQGF